MSDYDRYKNYPDAVLHANGLLDKFLEDIKEDHIATMNESQFKQDILPLITDTSGKVNMEKYQEIVGTSTREIRVIDDTTHEVLFIMPPLLRRVEVDVFRQRDLSPESINRTAIERSAQITAFGEKYFNQQVTDHYATHPIQVDHVRRMNQILTRYGYSPLTTEIKDEDTSSSDDNATLLGQNSPFSDEYEDL